MSEQQMWVFIGGLATPILIGISIGIINQMFGRGLKKKDDWECQIGNRVNLLETELALLKQQVESMPEQMLTEDKLRKILGEYFDRFELALVNERRIPPKGTKKENS